MNIEKLLRAVDETDPIRVRGKVNQVLGLVVEANGPPVSIGELCRIDGPDGSEPVYTEVVGFKENKVLMMPLGEIVGIGSGDLSVPGPVHAVIAND